MTDRGVIFSGPMVRALIAGRKRQTRRLATSPLRRCAPGDRLWVRENWQALSPGDYQPTTDGRYADVRYMATDPLADSDRDVRGYPWRPSIHMPRWASRLTLIVGRVWVERLQAISDADAEAEGVVYETADPPFWYVPGVWPHSLTGVEVEEGAAASYAKLWGHLHDRDGERWSDNPKVVAIEFEVQAANIDKLPA